MLLKDKMAQKTAKFMSSRFKYDEKHQILPKSIISVLEEVYKLGYDLAVDECLKDDSKSGDQMHQYLSTLEAQEDVK